MWSRAERSGPRDRRILFRALLPNALPPVTAQVCLQVATAILIEAGLAFLGLGDPTVVSWGTMLYNAQRFMRQAWWLAAFPGLALSLAILGVNLLGDGLTAAWNPRARREAGPQGRSLYRVIGTVRDGPRAVREPPPKCPTVDPNT
jgi:peptide/nickel transport system permease protein